MRTLISGKYTCKILWGITEKYLSQKFSESCPRSYLLDVNGSMEYIFKRSFFAERR